mgnify:CR=1 FL=1
MKLLIIAAAAVAVFFGRKRAEKHGTVGTAVWAGGGGGYDGAGVRTQVPAGVGGFWAPTGASSTGAPPYIPSGLGGSGNVMPPVPLAPSGAALGPLQYAPPAPAGNQPTKLDYQTTKKTWPQFRRKP